MSAIAREVSGGVTRDGAAKPPQDRWTEAVLRDLRVLIDEGGRSASGIAKALNDNHGFETRLTRSAVIGKCYRMGISLPGRGPGPAEPRPKRPSRAAVAAPARGPDGKVDLFATPVGPIPASAPLSAANRGHLLQASRDYDAYHLSLADWLEDIDDDGETRGERPAQPASTLPYWTGNDPVDLMDRGERSCSYVTCRSSKHGVSHYCGDDAPGGRFCTWHGRLSHTGQ